MTATHRSAIKLKKAKDYDLKKAKESIGQLYPVLKDSRGRIIDGMHRKEADKNWPEIVVESIKDEKDFLVAKIVTNLERRKPNATEKRKMLKELAAETGWTPDEIADHTDMSISWVRKYLGRECKDPVMSKLASRKQELTKARKIEEHKCKCGSPMYQIYCCLTVAQ